MTNTVTKGVNRPAATARTRKHAQRTPLPPRPGDVQDAKDAISAAQAPTPGYGKMTVAELRKRANELNENGTSVSRMNKGMLLNFILEAERKQATAAKHEERIRILDAGAKPHERNTSPKEQPLTPSEEKALGAIKGIVKANRLRDQVAPYGWGMETDAQSERVTATYRRNAETLIVVWDGGVFNYDESGHITGDRTTKIRNVSQARQMALRSPEEVAKEVERVASNRAWKRKAAANPPKRPEAMSRLAGLTDEELRNTLVGRVVEWENRFTNGYETSHISKNPKFFSVTGEGGDRIVQFCGDNGFHAFRLSALVRVGGSTRRRTKPAENSAA